MWKLATGCSQEAKSSSLTKWKYFTVYGGWVLNLNIFFDTHRNASLAQSIENCQVGKVCIECQVRFVNLFLDQIDTDFNNIFSQG